MRVVIDTDPGLDDAVGILYALNDPRFSVEAIITVAGNIGIATTTRNAGRLLAAMARADIPYASGAAGPLEGQGISEEAIHGADGLGGVTLPEPLSPPHDQPALDLLAQRLNAHEAGTLTILALGPLTNLARLAQIDREAYGRIGRVIAMGGTIREKGNAGPHAEFNMAADPHAADIVFAGPVPVTLIPLDVTRRLRATPEDLERLKGSGTVAAGLAADLIGAYFADNVGRESRPLHDPCVMLMAVAPELFETRQMRLAVDCQNHMGRLVEAADAPAIEVAMGVDASGALAALWAGLGGR